MQTIHLGILAMSILRHLVPLQNKLVKIAMHILLELANTLLAESMRHSLSFAGMLDSVSRIEESSLDADKSVVVLTLQESSAVTIDDGNGIGICDRHVMRLDPDQFAVFLVGCVDGQISPPTTTLVH